MKKIIILFLLVGYIFSATELSELLKIDELVSHFQEHKAQTKNISFSEFLYMHYVKDHSDNNQQNEKLPFKSQPDQASSSIFFHLISPSISYVIPYVHGVTSEQVNHFPIDNLFLKSSYLSSIWQPPQIIS